MNPCATGVDGGSVSRRTHEIRRLPVAGQVRDRSIRTIHALARSALRISEDRSREHRGTQRRRYLIRSAGQRPVRGVFSDFRRREDGDRDGQQNEQTQRGVGEETGVDQRSSNGARQSHLRAPSAHQRELGAQFRPGQAEVDPAPRRQPLRQRGEHSAVQARSGERQDQQ